MAIIAIRIGQNEADIYQHVDTIAKHLDVVDIIEAESLGRKGDEELLGIRFTWGNETRELKRKIRAEATKTWTVMNNDTDEVPISQDQMMSLNEYSAAHGLKKQWKIKAKNLYYLDLPSSNILPQDRLDEIWLINQFSKQQKFMMGNERVSINLKTRGVADPKRIKRWEDLKNYIINKWSGKSIAEELGL